MSVIYSHLTLEGRMIEITQEQWDAVLARIKKVVPWVQKHPTDKRALRLVSTYDMLHKRFEHCAFALLECCLEDVEKIVEDSQ